MGDLTNALEIGFLQIKAQTERTNAMVRHMYGNTAGTAECFREAAAMTEDEGFQRTLLDGANRLDRGLEDINGRAAVAREKVLK